MNDEGMGEGTRRTVGVSIGVCNIQANVAGRVGFGSDHRFMATSVAHHRGSGSKRGPQWHEEKPLAPGCLVASNVSSIVSLHVSRFTFHVSLLVSGEG